MNSDIHERFARYILERRLMAALAKDERQLEAARAFVNARLAKVRT